MPTIATTTTCDKHSNNLPADGGRGISFSPCQTPRPAGNPFTSSPRDTGIDDVFDLLHGDCLERMKGIPSCSINTCVTSPPYFGLRDYKVDGQIGLEPTPDEFVAALVAVFREVKRVLRDDGTVWLNLGDSYAANRGYQVPSTLMNGDATNEAQACSGRPQKAIEYGLKPKDLIGIPWRVAFALQADGWYLRQDIIWHKPNPMPESVTDRMTKAHEYIFLLSKKPKYYFDSEAIKEPAVGGAPGNTKRKSRPNQDTIKKGDQAGSVPWEGAETRNRRSVWTVTTKPFKGAHFATFPPDLIEPCIMAGCPEGGTVLDPFNGAGTTGLVSVNHGRKYIGIELNEDYLAMASDRITTAYLAKAEEEAPR